MKFMTPFLACIFFLTGAKAAPLKIASDEWCPYVCVEKKAINGGFIVDVVTAAMAKENVAVTPVFMPLNRSILEAEHGNIDGVYAPPYDQRLEFSEVLAHSRACFYTATSSKWKYTGLDSIQHIQFNVIADYGYDDGPMEEYLRQHGHQNSNINFMTGETAGETNAKMLAMGRVTAVLEHENVMTYLEKTQKLKGKIRNAGCLKDSLPLSVGFAKTDEGRKNSKLLKEGFQKIKKTGELKALKKKYKIIDR